MWKFLPLKIKSFLMFHIAQNKAFIPIRIWFAIVLSTSLSHIPDSVLMLVGGLILKAIWTIRYNNFASGQSRKRCLIVSFWSQWQHLGLPTHLRFISNYLWLTQPLVYKPHEKFNFEWHLNLSNMQWSRKRPIVN